MRRSNLAHRRLQRYDTLMIDRHKVDTLVDRLSAIGDAAIAVSGGVDSMTLASLAHRRLEKRQPLVVHAVSPAVPAAATDRVTAQARAERWRLELVDAGEFGDERYRANPLNRCYFCKSNLYATIAALAPGTVLSGANTDDLSDYRPGLEAAAEKDVRHPYIEVGFSKADVRELAKRLGLPELAELPASPCLASRVETGIAIDPADLALIDRVEVAVSAHFNPQVVRCRRREQAWELQLDEATLQRTNRSEICGVVIASIGGKTSLPILIAPYRRGSAFIRRPELASTF